MRDNSYTQSSTRALSPSVEPEYTSTIYPEEVHLRDYWKVLVKWRHVVVLTFLACVIIGAYFSLTATTIYTATAAIKIDPQAPSVTGIGMFGTAETAVGGPYDYYQTQYRLLESYALAETVVAKLGSVSLNRLTDVGPVASANPVSRITCWVSGWFRLLASSN